MNNLFISYNYAVSHNLPPKSQKLQEYWLASDGVYARSHRPELEICLQIAHTHIIGLAQIQPYFKLNVPKVPASIIADIINAARINPHQEILFYLGVANSQWWCHTPAQEASSTHVRSLENTNLRYSQTLVEIHSHGCMRAIPSNQDNQEESGKFRIFGIIGTVDKKPTIYTRVGAYNHFIEIDPNLIFEL
ncbi:MAG: Mov34/MPN/PAD-1 family protein [Tolypothrix carrinoi HA7290-LM1]|jgi:PRTRC genetic system protein A|nr:Mov34/MPN/PAD-1 family protein [Tolypothrix carrinoi HA7290-LM1]